MKKSYVTPSICSEFVTKEDILSISANRTVQLEEDIQGAFWEG